MESVDDDAYDEGFTHEALHVAWVLACTFEQHVCESRCAREFPDVQRAAELALNAMHDLYQLIGSK